MKVFRGIGSIPFNQINPYYTNDGDHLVYGKGTSYSLDEEQARFYCESSTSKEFGWILTYDYNPSKILEIYESNFENLDDLELENFNLNINNEEIVSYNLAEYARNNGYDCVKFIYDEFDQHILVINEKGLELESIKLFVESQELVDQIKKLEFYFDGEYFDIPLNQISKLNNIIF